MKFIYLFLFIIPSSLMFSQEVECIPRISNFIENDEGKEIFFDKKYIPNSVRKKLKIWRQSFKLYNPNHNLTSNKYYRLLFALKQNNTWLITFQANEGYSSCSYSFLAKENSDEFCIVQFPTIHIENLNLLKDILDNEWTKEVLIPK